jgi:hypothetical protein
MWTKRDAGTLTPLVNGEKAGGDTKKQKRPVGKVWAVLVDVG